ncbi:scale keratin-like [Empidonax traillii]|uniref:scale keratin-like n=1 Tax=Empidonax traillii TaxID=164674 RepID=UPI000FFD0DC4|nr:scale keratin-like [Empidonax traillii]
MTFCYQRQCEDSCYTPCNYGAVYSYRSYDCGSPCGYQSVGGLCGYRDCCPSYSTRYCSPYSTRYTQRYSYRSCYPCYPC